MSLGLDITLSTVMVYEYRVFQTPEVSVSHMTHASFFHQRARMYGYPSGADAERTFRNFLNRTLFSVSIFL